MLGATGQQGGETTKYLLRNRWKVRAFTINPSSENSLRLKKLGAEIFQGAMEDPSSLDFAMRDVYGVFSVQPPEWEPNESTDANEIKVGKLVADSCKKAKVSHLVYSSVIGAERQASFRTHKWEIEKYIHSLGIPFTILRPTGFMENLIHSRSGIPGGLLYETVSPDSRIHLISVEDIGVFAGLAFENPEKYSGRTIDLVGDSLTSLQIVDILSMYLDRRIEYMRIPLETVYSHNKILGLLTEWINREGYPKVDLDSLRREHPGLQNFPQWLEKTGKVKIEEASLKP
ncbi:NmrA/HSCARG family protein [Leptospira johnsonii]|uniref:NmrA/HSCARG family protein n=1 Tax=Leptospira johnsonii TaxID=1917820 RepID=UPI00142E0E84|nr:NmrA/HSCARG family protein [Leptospira johnsonii]